MMELNFPRHFSNLSYSTFSPLNTVDVYLPSEEAADRVESSPRYWLLYVHHLPNAQLERHLVDVGPSYIHGGAWRDPLVDAATIAPALAFLPPSELPIDGVASINYRISPYPSHATHPSAPDDRSRNAKHPDHIGDVVAAISWLQQRYGFGDRYVLAGHSCGAMLAVQAVMKKHWAEASDDGVGNAPGSSGSSMQEQPAAVVGVEGIYDLELLTQTHGEYYQTFVENAFGSDKVTWRSASPTSGRLATAWPNGKVVVLAHSKDDELVDFGQTEGMSDKLWKEKVHGRRDVVISLKGKHDEVWREGKELARAIRHALTMLTEVKP